MSEHSAAHKTSASKLARVEVKSRLEPSTVFNNLGHIIDMDQLRDCYRTLDGSKAVGRDGVTKDSYGKDLDVNLKGLLLRIRKGTYVPQASRIVEIPKLDGNTRPLTIACFEDKLVQESCTRILERIYEPLFLSESFGFRPGLSCHKALVTLDGHLKSPNNGAVIDVDLKKAFDTIPHKHLEGMIREKISDERFVRLLLKLIKSEVIDVDGQIKKQTCGVPQGSILSPLLCNVFLHYLVDEWFRKQNVERYFGKCTLVRYADDMVFTAPNIEAAKHLHTLLSERLLSYGMTLHEGKTRVIENGRATALRSASQGTKVPSFTFLGFVHVWGQSVAKNTGKKFWRVKRRTCPIRYRNKLHVIQDHLKSQRHSKDLLESMKRVVRGYLNYFAINDNMKRVGQFVREVTKMIYKWLNRRSQRRSFTWESFVKLLRRLNFPEARLQHNLFFHDEFLCEKVVLMRKPDALIGHVRF